MLQSIESLGLQCQQAWEEAGKIAIPRRYRTVKHILINGMGGSGLAGHVIESLYGDKMRVPFKVINSYTLPGFVNQETLYVLSSYSGTTEEVLATFKAARRRRAKLLIICAGGRLATLARRHRLPAYVFEPRFNPCNQPRMGLGYMLAGTLGLLAKAGLLAMNEGEVKGAIRQILSGHRLYGARVPFKRNKAKQLARAWQGRAPVTVAAGHLSGNAHILANQINENSKNFSNYLLISEMNHHLLEGLRFPKLNRHFLSFLFIESGRYLPRIQRRFAITKKILKWNRMAVWQYRAHSSSKLSQVVEVLLFGSYVNFYLAMLNGIDPSPIPFVGQFKKELGRR